jgi:type II restriction/modification system DNA methylase subunit YeeA
VIVGNPPFLGDKLMRAQLGDDYVEELRNIYGDRIPGQSDLCCYWFEKARDLIQHKHCKRAGLLGTQGIRGGANREVLKRIKENGDIFFAVSDRDWILDGANVHVSLVAFDDGTERQRVLDGAEVSSINPDLSTRTNVSAAALLLANRATGFIGVSMHGPFDLEEDQAIDICKRSGNPTGLANSDVVRPILNAFEITKRAKPRWVIAFDPASKIETAALYEEPMRFVDEVVRPVRDKNNRKTYRDHWWIHGEARPAMLKALQSLPRFLSTPRVSKHRVFVWVSPEYLPSDATVGFARGDDYFFGVQQSRFHEVWARSQGTQLRERESGFRYTPTTCFETFPLPKPKAAQEQTIAAAAKELNELRENWLNPPEWTATRVLEFPGSVDGPWSRFVHEPDDRGIGTVRYPRLEPRDEECAAKLKKRTLTNLYNERPAWLAHAHAKLDAAVAAAYGWPADLSDEEILERLLALNLERSAEEKRAAKTTSKKRSSRTKAEDEMI